MPLSLFIYNDLAYVRDAAGANLRFLQLLDRLEHTLRARPNVTLIEIDEQIERLAQAPIAAPFPRTLAIGAAGERIGRRLQARTGWFPVIDMVPVTRIEVAPGEYRIPPNAAVEASLNSIHDTPLAIVDDTLYSGMTLTWVLDRLPAAVAQQTQIFCLQAIGAALPAVRQRCTVYAGLEMPGEVEKDVSIIKASHLFEAGAIRRANGPDLAFFERTAWMQDWFGDAAAEITALCAELSAISARP